MGGRTAFFKKRKKKSKVLRMRRRRRGSSSRNRTGGGWSEVGERTRLMERRNASNRALRAAGVKKRRVE